MVEFKVVSERKHTKQNFSGRGNFKLIEIDDMQPVLKLDLNLNAKAAIVTKKPKTSTITSSIHAIKCQSLDRIPAGFSSMTLASLKAADSHQDISVGL